MRVSRGWLDDPRRAAVVAIGGALLLWSVITTAGAALAGRAPADADSWSQWDSAHYLSIAEEGYEIGSCDGVPDRDEDDLCGNAGWFPAYPYLIRPMTAIGLPWPAAGRVVSLAALGALLAACGSASWPAGPALRG